MEITNKAFSARRSFHTVPILDHVMDLGVISPPYLQTMPCERLGNTAGLDYLDLDFRRGATFVPPECASWLLEMEEDGSLITNKAFSARRSFYNIPILDHVMYLGVISPPYLKTMPCERLGKTAGLDYLDLDFRNKCLGRN